MKLTLKKPVFFWAFWSAAIPILCLTKYYFIYDESIDYRGFLLQWYNFMQAQGWSAFAEDFSNYMPFYLYFLKIGQTFFPDAPPIIVIKSVTFIGEAATAILVYRIVAERYPNSLVPSFAAFALLICPSVIINCAIGQCDIYLTFFVLAFIYAIYKQKPYLAIFLFGLAFSFKLISIFITPLIAILLLQRKIPLASLIMLPIAYCLVILPSLLLGRPIDNLLIIYFVQFDYYQNLSKFAANYYLFIPNQFYQQAVIIGSAIGCMAGLFIVYNGVKHKLSDSLESLLLTAAMCCAVFPFILPKMHDRYFFMADILTLVLSFINRRYIYPVILLQTASAFANQLFAHREWFLLDRVDLLVCAFLMNLVAIYTLAQAWKNSLITRF